MKGTQSIFVPVIILCMAIPAQAQFTHRGLENRAVQELKVYNQYLYAGTDQGLYQRDLSSSDASWKRLGLPNSRVSSFVIFSEDSLIVGTYEKDEQDSVYLHATFDGGTSWKTYQNGFGSDSTYRSVVDMDGAGYKMDTLYAVNRGEIYWSTDRGKQWEKLPLDSYYIHSKKSRSSSTQHEYDLRFVNAKFHERLAVYVGGQEDTYFGPRGTIRYSPDGGEVWQLSYLFGESVEWTNDDITYVNDAEVRPDQPGEAFAVGARKVMAPEVEAWGQLKWNPIFYHDKYVLKDLAISDAQPHIMYAGGQNYSGGLKLFRSESGGDNWSMFKDADATANDIKTLALHEDQGETKAYFGTASGVYQLNSEAQAMPADQKPSVQITSPADSSTWYYVEDTTEYYKGLDVHINAQDKDGQIEEYGWAIGDESYNWTSDSVVTIDNSDFGSAGIFTIHVTARDDDSLQATPDTVRIELIEPSFDKELLVVDGTNESDFERSSNLSQLTDSYIDSLYESWMRPVQVDHWDVSEQGVPPREVLAEYNGVYWHADNWYGNSSEAHKVGEHRAALGDYLRVGGDLMLSGWKVVHSMYPGHSFPIFPDSTDFISRYLKIESINTTSSSPPGDFVGAIAAEENYQDIEIDSSLVDGYPAGFFENMVEVNYITDLRDGGQPFLTLQCRPECGNPKWEGTIVALKNQEKIFSSAFIGFPLTFIKYDQAAATVHQLLDDFGYEETSLSGREQPDRYSLQNNYPNPFNPTTKIRFSLPQASNLRLVVYDVLGRHVKTLINEQYQAGKHSVTFDGQGLSSGVYMYQLKADGFSQTRKMLLVR